MEPVDRTSENLRGLVTDLDGKLAHRREPVVVPSSAPAKRGVPGWLGIALVTLLGIGIGFAVVQPWQPRCSYGRDVCAVAKLDIDALRVTIPDSELIALLPNIDALDPNDELTAGDIFAMERFAHIDFEEVLTDEDIDRLLGKSG